jgi:hypothetical protein
LRRVEFPGVGEDLDETSGKASEKTAWGVFGKAAVEHLQDVLGGFLRVDQAGQIRARRGRRRDDPRWRQVSGMRAGQVEFALEILLGDFEIPQGHVRALVAEEFHDAGKADARS